MRTTTLSSGAKKAIAFLVFRGTEPKDFQDIKSDVSAALKKLELDGEIIELHTGYHAAFEAVRADIESTLGSTGYDQLFITGHSLGGAIAIVATRILASDITGACYTFGAPPVGTIAVQNTLKTPVYQIVNEIDIVPRLPNPWAISAVRALLRLFRLAAKMFTITERLLASGAWDERLEAYIISMTQYRHPGYVSYLVGSGDAARLRYNVGAFDQFRWWFAMITKRGIGHFRKMVTDHAIDVYVDKLRVHAQRRQ